MLCTGPNTNYIGTMILYSSKFDCSNKKKGILPIETEGTPERDKLSRNYVMAASSAFISAIAAANNSFVFSSFLSSGSSSVIAANDLYP